MTKCNNHLCVAFDFERNNGCTLSFNENASSGKCIAYLRYNRFMNGDRRRPPTSEINKKHCRVHKKGMFCNNRSCSPGCGYYIKAKKK